ncbi:MAG: FtsX-like permease family protein [Chthoniobacterales bacterium]
MAALWVDYFLFSGFEFKSAFLVPPCFFFEIGLHRALGAQLSDVQKLIVRQGMWPARVGSLLGLALALAGARRLKRFLYGVSASDPITFTFIAFTLLTIAFLACRIPPRRASRVERLIALRAE